MADYTNAQIDAKIAAAKSELDTKFQNLHNGQQGHLQSLITRMNCVMTEMKKAFPSWPCT